MANGTYVDEHGDGTAQSGDDKQSSFRNAAYCGGSFGGGFLAFGLAAGDLSGTGLFAGCLLGALLLLLVNPWYALFFIIFTIILQIFDGYIFKPKIFGNRFGVSAIWILIFLVVGGRLFGVSGILLAIP